MIESEYLRNVEDVKEWIQDKHLPAIAEDTGITYMTLKRIKIGATKRPKKETLGMLVSYMEEFNK